MRLLPGLLLATSLLPVSAALAESDSAGVQWLQRIYAASQKLSYTGTFVYHHDNTVETSRITRVVDASGPVEKLEALDGDPREIVRSGDQVVCYYPRTMTMKIDKQSGRTSFPVILSDQIKELTESYVIRTGEVERVAGHDCQVIVLQPKDNLRYGQRLCADVGSGMLLKAKTFNEKHGMLEAIAFTQIQIGGNIDRSKVKSRFAANTKAWHVEDSGAEQANLGEAGWSVRAQPPGFRKIMEMTRTLNGKSGVGHIVFSDGLVAVSVFIEPPVAHASGRHAGLSRQGAINIYARQVGDHWVTVVGEAPPRASS